MRSKCGSPRCADQPACLPRLSLEGGLARRCQATPRAAACRARASTGPSSRWQAAAARRRTRRTPLRRGASPRSPLPPRWRGSAPRPIRARSSARRTLEGRPASRRATKGPVAGRAKSVARRVRPREARARGTRRTTPRSRPAAGRTGDRSADSMGPSATPMLTRRPPGRSAPKAEAICFAELVVERMTSKPPAARRALPGSAPPTTTSCAPIAFRSADFPAWPVTAQVSSPTACESWSARWPRPPRPSTATRSPGLGSALRSPLMTV